MGKTKMKKYQYDLHTHSVYSDGMYTFPDLIKVLKENGIKGFAITDHNCAGPLNELEEIANKENISLIKGTELKASIQPLLDEAGIKNPIDEKGDSKYEQVGEILCYGLDTNNKEFVTDSKAHLAGKIPYAKAFCDIISTLKVGEINGLKDHPRKNEKLGNLFDMAYKNKLSYFKGNPPQDDLLYIGTGEPMTHIMEEFNLDKPTAKVFVYNYLTQALKKSGIDKTDPFYGTDIRDIVKKSKRYGKVSVLAHPLTNKRKNLIELYDKIIIPQLVEAGLDGIEKSYPEHSKEDEKIIESWQDKFGLKILTGGCDFHRKKEISNLGNSGVDEKTWNYLLALINQR